MARKHSDDPPEEEEVILEPGDPGYAATDEPPLPDPEPGPPPQDLRAAPEMEGAYAVAVHAMHTNVVDSQNPADIVPNHPQITMGAQPPAEPVAAEEA
jgi:hypothetical protein